MTSGILDETIHNNVIPVVRFMTAEDLDAVSELEQICFSEPWSKALLAESLALGEYLFLVAEEPNSFDGPRGTRIAGYLGARIVLDELDITNVAVFPEMRGRGAGRALMERLLREAEARKCFGVTLEVRVSNDVAISLYEKMGFVREGVRKGFYSDPVEDALIMWKYFNK